MIYLIDNKYYVKVGKDFTEVELVFTDDDVDLKPTNNKLENNGNIPYVTINFLNEKQELLKQFKNKDKNKEEFSFNNTDKLSKRSKESSFK